MEKINTKSCAILCVEVPEDSHDIEIIDGDTAFYWLPGSDKNGFSKTGQVDFDRISYEWYKKLSELTDKDCEEFAEIIHVEIAPSPYNDWGGSFDYAFKDYENPGEYAGWQGDAGCFRKAKQSFITLLQSEGIDTSNEDKLLIIKIIDEDS